MGKRYVIAALVAAALAVVIAIWVAPAASRDDAGLAAPPAGAPAGAPVAATPSAPAPLSPARVDADTVARLREEIAELRRDVAELRQALERLGAAGGRDARTVADTDLLPAAHRLLEAWVRSYAEGGTGSQFYRLAVDAHASDILVELTRLLTDARQPPALRSAIVIRPLGDLC